MATHIIGLNPFVDWCTNKSLKPNVKNISMFNNGFKIKALTSESVRILMSGSPLGLCDSYKLLRGQSSVVVKCPHCNNKDVGLNPTATRNKNQTLGDSSAEDSQRV